MFYPRMKPLFFDPRRSRTTAATVLFVWGLVFGTGIAQACLGHEDTAQHAHAGHQEAAPAALPQTPADVVADLDAHPEWEACPHPAALEQAVVVKKRTLGSEVPDAFLVSSDPRWWRGVTAPDCAASSPVGLAAPAPAGPPLFIRFLRLTI